MQIVHRKTANKPKQAYNHLASIEHYNYARTFLPFRARSNDM